MTGGPPVWTGFCLPDSPARAALALHIAVQVPDCVSHLPEAVARCMQVNLRYSKLELALDGLYKVILLLKKKKYAAIKFETGPDGTEREVNAAPRCLCAVDHGCSRWCSHAPGAWRREGARPSWHRVLHLGPWLAPLADFVLPLVLLIITGAAWGRPCCTRCGATRLEASPPPLPTLTSSSAPP